MSISLRVKHWIGTSAVLTVAIILLSPFLNEGVRAEESFCLRLGLFANLNPDLASKLREPNILNHIRKTDNGYEVLLLDAEGYLEVKQVRTLEEAFPLLGTIEKPLNLQLMITAAEDALGRILEDLKGVGKIEKASEFSTRPKDVEKLKKKIFDKTLETPIEKPFKYVSAQAGEGGKFIAPGRQIDDFAGARYIVPDKKTLLAVAKRLGTPEKVAAKKIAPWSRYEWIQYKRGYRAVHITLEVEGVPVEIQIMTERTASWSKWNHDRVYKSAHSKNSAYFYNLKRYNQDIVDYLNALDSGLDVSVKPNPKNYGILPEDIFPEEKLR